MRANVVYPLLMSLFDPHSPGHDGALLIENDRVAAYALRLPLSESDSLSDEYGTRHYAGLGLSKVTDALVIVVSEERGLISVAYNGRIVQRLDINRLRSVLLAFFQHQLGGRGWTKRV